MMKEHAARRWRGHLAALSRDAAAAGSGRRAAIVVALGSLLLAGCVATHVSGKTVAPEAAAAQRVLVVVVHTRLSENNIAASLGQRNLNQLVPHLVERLPAVFARNGLPARAVKILDPKEMDLAANRPAEGEHVLLVIPRSATYSSQYGQSLNLQVELAAGPPPPKPIWSGRISMNTLGGASWDSKVANDVAVQVLEQLRNAKVATVRAGDLAVE